MPKFPTDAADIPTYFEGLEKLYSSFDGPSSLQAKLLLPYLSDKAKSLLLRLEQSKQDVYIEVKKSLLNEFGVARNYACNLDTGAYTSSVSYGHGVKNQTSELSGREIDL